MFLLFQSVRKFRKNLLMHFSFNFAVSGHHCLAKARPRPIQPSCQTQGPATHGSMGFEIEHRPYAETYKDVQ